MTREEIELEVERRIAEEKRKEEECPIAGVAGVLAFKVILTRVKEYTDSTFNEAFDVKTFSVYEPQIIEADINPFSEDEDEAAFAGRIIDEILTFKKKQTLTDIMSKAKSSPH